MSTMIPLTASTPISSRGSQTIIKLHSPRSEIKNDDVEIISQAWNKLKITSVSKAIMIASQVGRCSFSPPEKPPNTPKLNASLSCGSDALNTSSPKTKNAATSTPLKLCKSQDSIYEREDIDSTVSKRFATSFANNKSCSMEGSNSSSHLDDINEFEVMKEKLIAKIENTLLKSVFRKNDDHKKKFDESDSIIQEKSLELKLKLERERIIRTQEHYYDAQKAMIEAKESAFKFQELQESKLDYDQRIADTNERIRQNEIKRKELEEKHKQKREELKTCIDGIYDVQIAYRKKYNHITEITKKCRNVKLLNEKMSDDIPKLKGLNEVILMLVEKCKEGKVTLQDLYLAQGLLQQLDAICEQFRKHTDSINKSISDAEEAKKREKLEEIETKDKEIQLQNKAAENKQKAEPELEKSNQQFVNLSSDLDDCFSLECLQWHQKLSTYLQDYEKKLQPLLQADSMKKFRLECKKVVNVPVNAISPLDDLHLQDKLYKLSRMLRGEPVPIGQTMFLPTGHPLGVAYCTNLLAEKFVNQGEHTVSRKPEAAFAIAAVIVALWVDFPQFGILLLAHFHRTCPYLIPAFMPQLEGQSNEEFYKTLGYEYSAEGKVEPQDQFLRRMSGVARLYAAILVTPQRRAHATSPHPHGLREAWRWLAATINLKPRADISATLLFDVLEITGHAMMRTYRLQFTKLVHILCADYFPIIQQVTPDGCGGPVVRLKSFLEKVLKEGQIPPPSGRLPPNFW